jgi:hypothetical protein
LKQRQPSLSIDHGIHIDESDEQTPTSEYKKAENITSVMVYAMAHEIDIYCGIVHTMHHFLKNPCTGDF